VIYGGLQFDTVMGPFGQTHSCQRSPKMSTNCGEVSPRKKAGVFGAKYLNELAYNLFNLLTTLVALNLVDIILPLT
jgi:hypothetical protein